MGSGERHAVTGAFGYSGKYIAKRLLEKGHSVITLTNSVNRANPFGEHVKAFPFHFDQTEKLTEQLRGVTTLYNTYWIRFNHKTFTQADAVKNTQTLFLAAKEAGVKHVVHISIANPMPWGSSPMKLPATGSLAHICSNLMRRGNANACVIW